jgi:hypothetical protein
MFAYISRSVTARDTIAIRHMLGSPVSDVVLVGVQVITAVTVKSSIFRDVTPCSRVKLYLRTIKENILYPASVWKSKLSKQSVMPTSGW